MDMGPFDYNSAARQVTEYEKSRKNIATRWKYIGLGYERGARYGRILPETGYMYLYHAGMGNFAEVLERLQNCKGPRWLKEDEVLCRRDKYLTSTL
jgi:hypothetical protein